MGLDIYLYRYDKPIEEIKKLEEEYERKSDENWKRFEGIKYDKITEEQRSSARKIDKNIEKELGLGEYGKHPDKVEIYENSSKYPDHLFKVGYFRSSYNDSGFNSIMRNLGLQSLDEIIGYTGEYEFEPNWNQVKINAWNVINQLNKKDYILKSFFVGKNPYSDKCPANSQKQAIKITQDELDREQFFKGGYSNINGEFFPEGLEIVGLVPTAEYGGTGVTVIHKTSNDWYIQALEIVIETCEYIVNNPGTYRLHWSS